MGGRTGADPDPCTGKEADPHPYVEGSRGTDPDLRIGGKLTLTPAQEKRRLTLTPAWEGGEWLTLILHVGELTLTPAQEEEKDWPRTLKRGVEPCPGGSGEDTPLVSRAPALLSQRVYKASCFSCYSR